MLLELMPAATGIAAVAVGAWPAEIERQLRSRSNDKASTEWVQCPCKHYDGPAPPAQTFAPYVPWPPT